MIATGASGFPRYTCKGWAASDTLPKGLTCYTDYDDKIFCSYVRDKTTTGKTCTVLCDYSSRWVQYGSSCTMDSKTDACVITYEMPYTFLSFHVINASLTCRGSTAEDEVVMTGRFKPSCNIHLHSPNVSCVAHACTVNSYLHERFDDVRPIEYMYQVSKDNGATWSESRVVTGPNATAETTFTVDDLEDGVITSIKVSVAYKYQDRYTSITTHFGQFTTLQWTP